MKYLTARNEHARNVIGSGVFIAREAAAALNTSYPNFMKLLREGYYSRENADGVLIAEISKERAVNELHYNPQWFGEHRVDDYDLTVKKLSQKYSLPIRIIRQWKEMNKVDFDRHIKIYNESGYTITTEDVQQGPLGERRTYTVTNPKIKTSVTNFYRQEVEESLRLYYTLVTNLYNSIIINEGRVPREVRLHFYPRAMNRPKPSTDEIVQPKGRGRPTTKRIVRTTKRNQDGTQEQLNITVNLDFIEKGINLQKTTIAQERRKMSLQEVTRDIIGYNSFKEQLEALTFSITNEGYRNVLDMYYVDPTKITLIINKNVTGATNKLSVKHLKRIKHPYYLLTNKREPFNHYSCLLDSIYTGLSEFTSIKFKFKATKVIKDYIAENPRKKYDINEIPEIMKRLKLKCSIKVYTEPTYVYHEKTNYKIIENEMDVPYIRGNIRERNQNIIEIFYDETNKHFTYIEGRKDKVYVCKCNKAFNTKKELNECIVNHNKTARKETKKIKTTKRKRDIILVKLETVRENTITCNLTVIASGWYDFGNPKMGIRTSFGSESLMNFIVYLLEKDKKVTIVSYEGSKLEYWILLKELCTNPVINNKFKVRYITYCKSTYYKIVFTKQCGVFDEESSISFMTIDPFLTFNMPYNELCESFNIKKPKDYSKLNVQLNWDQGGEERVNKKKINMYDEYDKYKDTINEYYYKGGLSNVQIYSEDILKYLNTYLKSFKVLLKEIIKVYPKILSYSSISSYAYNDYKAEIRNIIKEEYLKKHGSLKGCRLLDNELYRTIMGKLFKYKAKKLDPGTLEWKEVNAYKTFRNVEDSEFVRFAIYGGILKSESNKVINKELIEIDCISQYPSVMKNPNNRYPIGKYKYTNKYIKDKLGIYECSILRQDVAVIVPRRENETEKLDWSYTGPIDKCVITNIAIEQIKKYNGKGSIHVMKGIYWEKDVSGEEMFGRYIEKWGNIKLQQSEYKKNGNALFNPCILNTSKRMLTSLSGKMMQKPFELVTEFVTTRHHGEKVLKNFKYTETHILSNKLEIIHGELLNTTKKIIKPCYIGAFILDYAKRLMQNNILRGTRSFYTYIDSALILKRDYLLLKNQNPTLFENSFGCFKNEYETIQRAYIVSPGFCCYVNSKGQVVKIATRGINKDAEWRYYIVKGKNAPKLSKKPGEIYPCINEECFKALVDKRYRVEFPLFKIIRDYRELCVKKYDIYQKCENVDFGDSDEEPPERKSRKNEEEE